MVSDGWFGDLAIRVQLAAKGEESQSDSDNNECLKNELVRC